MNPTPSNPIRLVEIEDRLFKSPEAAAEFAGIIAKKLDDAGGVVQLQAGNEDLGTMVSPAFVRDAVFEKLLQQALPPAPEPPESEA